MSQPVSKAPGVWSFNDFRGYFPEYGWIRDYVAYAIGCTDAPPLYHILTASAVVSAAIAPQMDLIHGEVAHPLHEFFMIVGDAGENRKGTAMNMALKVASPTLQGAHKESRVWRPENCSPEGLQDGLSLDPNRLMVFGEWTSLQRSARAGYWQHATEFWNTLYDAVDLNRAKANGKTVNVVRPRVTILGGTTTSLVKDTTTVSDWLAGRLSRYIIGYMQKPDEYFMDCELSNETTVKDLRNSLHKIVVGDAHKKGRHMIFSEEAWQVMRAWLHDPTWRAFLKNIPEHLRASFTRAQEHAYRLSAIFQVSMSYPFSTIVGREAAEAAIACITWCFESQVQAFSLLAAHDFDPMARVEYALRMSCAGGMSKPELLQYSRLTIRKLDEILGTLHACGTLLTTGVKKDQRYYFIAKV